MLFAPFGTPKIPKTHYCSLLHTFLGCRLISLVHLEWENSQQGGERTTIGLIWFLPKSLVWDSTVWWRNSGYEGRDWVQILPVVMDKLLSRSLFPPIWNEYNNISQRFWGEKVLNIKCLLIMEQAIRWKMQAVCLLTHLTFLTMILWWAYGHFISFALLTHQKASVMILVSQLTQRPR